MAFILAFTSDADVTIAADVKIVHVIVVEIFQIKSVEVVLARIVILALFWRRVSLPS